MNKLLLVLTVLIAINTSLGAQDIFEFSGKKITPGTKAHIQVTITALGTESFIPVTIFHGKQKGPVLAITAGVHGYEYAPILAGQQLIEKIDPTKLNGTVILVNLANVESFLKRSPFVNPLDQKNLNRSFPGNPDGSTTEVIADFISKKVIARSDFFLDMHSGDAPEDLMPYVAYYHHDSKKKISETGLEMAKNMGFDHIVRFDATGKDYMQPNSPSLYCSAEAFKRGIPSVDIECGRLGIVEDEMVMKITDGVLSLLKQVGQIEGIPIPSPGLAIITQRSSLSSSGTGFFYPLKSSGDYVKKGMKIGYTTDFFNRKKEDVLAPVDGVILFMLGTPAVNEGETLASFGVMK